MMPGRFSGLATTKLALTNKRVLGKTGLLRQKTLAIAYTDVETAHVQRGLLGTLFDYGSVTIVTKDGSRVKFRGIAEPLDVQMQIEEEAEMVTLGRKLSQVVIGKW